MNSVARVLLIIGGLNLGFIGAGHLLKLNQSLDVINLFKAFHPLLPAIIHSIIGIAAVYSMFKKY